jgi:hypothetical protein
MIKLPIKIREVLDCASPLALLASQASRRKSGRGLPQSKTLSREVGAKLFQNEI